MIFLDFWGTCKSLSMYECNRVGGFAEPLNRSVVEAYHFPGGHGDLGYPMPVKT